MNGPEGQETARFYTRGRKIQLLIGTTPQGGKIWGGPYTITQAIGFGAVVLVGWLTMDIWALDEFFINIMILAGVAVGTLYGLGKIPLGARSPIVLANGLYQAISAPRSGTLGGRKIQPMRPVHVIHKVTVLANSVASRPDTTAVPVADQVPVPVSSRRSRRHPSQLQQATSAAVATPSSIAAPVPGRTQAALLAAAARASTPPSGPARQTAGKAA